MNAYERLIEQHAKDDVYSFSELSEAEQTELATAYYEHEAPQDISEIMFSDPSPAEMFARAREGDYAELGVLFIRALHCSVQGSVDRDFERWHRREAEAREMADEERLQRMRDERAMRDWDAKRGMYGS